MALCNVAPYIYKSVYLNWINRTRVVNAKMARVVGQQTEYRMAKTYNDFNCNSKVLYNACRVARDECVKMWHTLHVCAHAFAISQN